MAATGGTLTLGFSLAPAPRPALAGEGDRAARAEITAWIVIEPDNSIVIRVAKSEMGQGVATALCMLVAEELECDWTKVRPEYALPHQNLSRDRVWGDMSTGGSRSIRSSQEPLRQAGAMARTMLISAAAKYWNVSSHECFAAKSVITHRSSGRTVSYGAIAAAAAKMPVPDRVTLKDPKTWTRIGRPTRRLDVADKVRGKPIYGIDVRLPNMLYAALLQCPVFKGSLTAVDDSAVSGMKGICRVIRLRDSVAVVADTWWRAQKAIDVLQATNAITWDVGAHGDVSSASIDAFLREGLKAMEAGVGRRDGDVAVGLARSARRVEADYSVPFLAHATLEPQNCTAVVNGDHVEIWVPTQNGEAALATAAQTAGVPPRNVIVHRTMLGGGFGRRGAVQDFVPHAVLIAKQMGQPVQTIWSREEDMRHDYFRPVAMARMTAGLDASNKPIAWHIRLTGNSILGTLTPFALRRGVDTQFQEGFLQEMAYDIPNYLVDYAMRNTHVPVGFWRCVNHSQNTFFKESFVDELAHAAGEDPYEYRCALLGKHPHAEKYRRVLDAAATAADWRKPLPEGVARGIAVEDAFGTFVAGVVEVSVDANGQIKVHRVVCAIDPGYVVNPLTVEHQTQSAVVFGLTAALHGEVTIKNGRVEQSNFHDYAMLKMAETPVVETVLVPSGNFWGGCGEPPLAIVAPALCNALFAATGMRIRSLPLKNHDLRPA